MNQTISHDDDQTQIVEAPVTAGGGNALRPGTRLLEFEIVRVLGSGGFGIVYLATDTALKREVALKEYMPVALAARGAGTAVVVGEGRDAAAYEAGLRSFIGEAQMLAQFNHPSLIKVHRFWEGNGTAYTVMQYFHGKTLKAALGDGTVQPTEAWLRGLLEAMLSALEVMHSKQCLHRDIAPDNILLPDGHAPVLLDLGAARRVIEGMQSAMTAILKPAYAPIEQYGDNSDVKQGPWTDLYALAAVVYRAVMGEVPQPALERMLSDKLKPLEVVAQESMPGRYGNRFLQAIDRALALRPEDRPQSVVEFQALLGREGTESEASAPAPVPVPTPPPSPQQPPPAPRTERNGKRTALAAGGSVLALALASAWFARSGADTPPTSVAATPRPPPQAERNQEPPPSHVALPQPSPVAAAQPSAPPQPSPLAPPPKPVHDPLRALQEIVSFGNNNHEVTAKVQQEKLVIGKDALQFTLQSSKPGYVYVLMAGSDQKSIVRLFPNAADQMNRIEAGKPLQLPRPGVRFAAQGPQGTDRLVALVSDSPRDFGAAGMDRDGTIPLERLKKLHETYQGPAPMLAGLPKCKKAAACPGSYGAAAFSVEEVRGK